MTYYSSYLFRTFKDKIALPPNLSQTKRNSLILVGHILCGYWVSRDRQTLITYLVGKIQQKYFYNLNGLFKILIFLYLKIVLLMRIGDEMLLSAVRYDLFVLVAAYSCAVVLPVTVILMTCFYFLGHFVHSREKPLILDFTIISRPSCRWSRTYTVARDLLLVFLNKHFR